MVRKEPTENYNSHLSITSRAVIYTSSSSQGTLDGGFS